MLDTRGYYLYNILVTQKIRFVIFSIIHKEIYYV